MVRLWLTLVLVVCAVSIFAAEAGEGMLYVEFRMEPSQEWARQSPRKLWVARDKFMRTDEPPDSAGGLHLSLIVAEPDCWIVNRFENRAMHVIDQGPTYVVRPMIYGHDPSSALGKLEFGHELAFFHSYGATALPDTVLDGVNCARLGTTVDSLPLVLYYVKESAVPKLITFIDAGETVKVIYEKYQTGLPVDTTLFRPPDGVTIQEQK